MKNKWYRYRARPVAQRSRIEVYLRNEAARLIFLQRKYPSHKLDYLDGKLQLINNSLLELALTANNIPPTHSFSVFLITGEEKEHFIHADNRLDFMEYALKIYSEEEIETVTLNKL